MATVSELASIRSAVAAAGGLQLSGGNASESIMRDLQAQCDWTYITAIEQSIELYRREYEEKLAGRKLQALVDPGEARKMRAEHSSDGIGRLP